MNVSIPQVMSIVGHSDMDTTNVYLRMAAVDIKGATENLGIIVPKETFSSVLNFRKGQS